MNLTFAPRRRLAEYLSKGWRLLPSHEYAPGDFAILMFMPEVSSEMSAKVMQTVAARFLARPKPRSNKSCGACSRQWQRFHRKMESA